MLKLFDLYNNNDLELPADFEIIKKSIVFSIDQGTAIRNAPKLMSDFYFSVFHPIEHFSFKVSRLVLMLNVSFKITFRLSLHIHKYLYKKARKEPKKC